MSNPAYPALFIGKDSRRTMRDGRTEDQIGDGSTRVRKLFADKFDFEITHPGVPLTDTGAELGVATLQTFYNAHGTDAEIDFTWRDGNVYTVRFGKGGLDIQLYTPTRRNVKVRLVGV